MPIKLGRTMSEPSMKLSAPSHESEEYFPNVHLEWDKDYELPDEGTMTVKFRISRESREVQAERQSVDLDLIEIVSVTADEPKAKESEDTGEALDKLRAEYEADDTDEE